MSIPPYLVFRNEIDFQSGHWRTDVGDIDGFDYLVRIAERLYLDCFQGCSLHRR
jgi:hypothetical protein